MTHDEVVLIVEAIGSLGQAIRLSAAGGVLTACLIAAGYFMWDGKRGG